MTHNRFVRASRSASPALMALLVLSALVACAPRPHAAPPSALAEPLVSDRPDFTESTSLIEPRHLQVEAGNTYGREDGETANAFGEVLLRLGIRPRTELRVGLNSVVRSDAGTGAGLGWSGWEDPSVGVKLGFLESDRARVPSVSLIVGSTIPAGSRALRGSAAEPEAKVLLAWDVGGGWGISSNLNYSVLSLPGNTRIGEPSASLSFSRSLTERVGSYLEAFAFQPAGATGTRFVNGGVTVLLGNDLQLDARAGSGVGANRKDYFVGVGLVRRW